MTESNNSTGLINKVIDLAKYWPSICFAFAAPSGYLLFGSKSHKAFILANPDLIELNPTLNPEIGLIFLYLSSIVLTAFLRALLSPVQDWWYEKKVIRHRKIHDPLSSIGGKSKHKPTLRIITFFVIVIISISLVVWLLNVLIF